MKSAGTENSESRVVTLLGIAVIIVGAMVAFLAVAQQGLDPQHAWMLIIALSLFVAPMSAVEIPGIKASVVMGDVITFSCAILFGPAAAVIAAVADGAITSLRLTKSSKKFFYNVATCAISMAGASALAGAVFSRFGIRDARVPFIEIVGEAGLLTIGYFVISTVLIASYVAFSKGVPLVRLWREKFFWTVLSYIASGASCLAAYLLVGRVGLYIFTILIAVMLILCLSYRSYFLKSGGGAVGHAA